MFCGLETAKLANDLLVIEIHVNLQGFFRHALNCAQIALKFDRRVEMMFCKMNRNVFLAFQLNPTSIAFEAFDSAMEFLVFLEATICLEVLLTLLALNADVLLEVKVPLERLSAFRAVIFEFFVHDEVPSESNFLLEGLAALVADKAWFRCVCFVYNVKFVFLLNVAEEFYCF